MSMTLCFLPDGTVQGTYAELIDLSCLGWLKVRRLSAVEFDNPAQLWRVFDRKGRCVFSSASRNDCLRWEQEFLAPPGDDQTAG